MSGAPTSVKNLWATANGRLKPKDRSQLCLDTGKDGSPLQAVLLLVQEKHQLCIEKRWRFKKRSGEEIVIRDLFEKAAHWINRFKEVGDIVLQYDPAHAALPWAGVRFLLNVAVSDVDIFMSIAEGVETTSRLIARCALYEAVYLVPMMTLATASPGLLEEAIVGLYVEILTYLAKAAKYYQTGAGKRLMESLVKSSVTIEEQWKAMMLKEKELESILRTLEGEKMIGMSHMMTSLNISSTENQETLRAVKKLVLALEQPLTRFSGLFEQIEHNMEVQERSQMMRWLSNVHYHEQHERIAREILPGTGEWLFKRSEYQQWQNSSSSAVLWLRGIPGCGKSNLFSLVADKLSISSHADPNITPTPVAYFYCSKTNNHLLLDSRTILCSILKQLACSKPGNGVHGAVVSEYRRRRNIAELDGVDVPFLTLDVCRELIVSVASDCPIHILVDGVDEMDDVRGLLEVLQQVVDESSNIVKIFISSRDEADVDLWLKDVTCIAINSSDNSADIAKFIQHRVDAAIRTKRLLKGQVGPELKQQIISKLNGGAGSMFLWVALHLAQLCDQKRFKLDKDVVTALESLPVGLEKMFDQLYKNINEYEGRARHLTKSVFAWLLAAQRPLSKEELIVAVSCQEEEKYCQPNEKSILDFCSGFLEHNSVSQHFTFAHASIIEYLQSLPEYSSSNINQLAAQRCLEYLFQFHNFSDLFNESGSNSPDSVVDTSNSYPPGSLPDSKPYFKDYAVCYWARHYAKITDRTRGLPLDEVLMRFIFGDGGSMFELWLDDVQELVDNNLVDSARLAKELAAANSNIKSAIFIASVYGILPIFERLAATRDRVDWDAKNIHGAPAIYISARFGQPEAIRYLLEQGCDVNSQGGHFMVPAQAAAFHGNTTALELLARNGADLHTRGRFKNTFDAALMGSQPGAMELLLNGPWASEVPDVDNLLDQAAYDGHYEIVELLLRRKGELNISAKSPLSSAIKWETSDQSQSEFRHGALQIALYSGYSGSRVALKLLKDLGDINRPGGHFGNALQAACAGGHLPSVRWLLKQGAHVNSIGRYGSALKAASLGGHDDVVRLLLGQGASITLPKNFDAIEAAASRNRLSTLTLLVEHFVTATDILGKTSSNSQIYEARKDLRPALESACFRGYVDVVRYLLANGAEQFAAYGLEAAIRSGQEEVVKILLAILPHIPDYIRYEMTFCSISSGILDLVPEGWKVRPKFGLKQRENTEKSDHTDKYDNHDQSDQYAVNFLATKIDPALEENLKPESFDIDRDSPQGLKFISRLAALKGSKVVLENLLSKGLSPDGYGEARPIEIAALHGRAEIVAVLLENNANPGYALQCAVKSDREDIVRLILSKRPEAAIDTTVDVPPSVEQYHKASILNGTNERWPADESVEESPLALAMAYENEGITRLLLEHGTLVHWPEPSLALVLYSLRGNEAKVLKILSQIHGPTSSFERLARCTNVVYAARASAARGHVAVVDAVFQLVSSSQDARLIALKEITHEAATNHQHEVMEWVNNNASLSEKEHIAGIKLMVLLRNKYHDSKAEYHDSEAEIKEILGTHMLSGYFKSYLEKALQEALRARKQDVAQQLLETKQLDDYVRNTPDILHVAMDPQDRSRWDRGETTGLLEIVSSLIGIGANIEGLDRNMRTPIYYACVNGYGRIFQTLLSHGADIFKLYDASNSNLNESTSPLVTSYVGGNVGKRANLLDVALCSLNARYPYGLKQFKGIIFRLLEAGLAINDETIQFFLHYACSSGDIVSLGKLLKHGIDPNLFISTRGGRMLHLGSGMHVAAVRGHIDAVNLLIKHGTWPSAEVTCGDALGTHCITPIQAVLKWGNENRWEMCTVLIEAGAVEYDCQLVLEAAGEQGNLPLVRQLLDQGIRLSNIPITSSIDVIKLFIKHGTNINGRATELQEKAVEEAWHELLEYLVEETGLVLPTWTFLDKVLLDKPKKTAKDQKMLLQVLLKNGNCDFNRTDECPCGNGQRSIFRRLIMSFNLDLIKYALAEGADPLCPGFPDTAISYMFMRRHLESYRDKIKQITKMLLNHGDNINGINKVSGELNTPNQPPLLFTVTQSELVLTQFLIDHGADVNRGIISPLQFAYWSEEKFRRPKAAQITGLLKAKGAVARPIDECDNTHLHVELQTSIPWLPHRYLCSVDFCDHCGAFGEINVAVNITPGTMVWQ